MPDMEKVVKGLTDIYDEAYDRWVHCQYNQDKLLMLIDKTIPDVLAMLQEQEPVKPIRLENWWGCPSCNGNIVANMKYCPSCGKAVKWDDTSI